MTKVHLVEDVRRRLLESMDSEELEKEVFPVLEDEADQCNCQNLMDWYQTLLKMEISPQMRERALQRLTFFYLNGVILYESPEGARQFLQCMQDEGIHPANPYSGHLARFDYSDLIQALSGEDWELKMPAIRLEYIRVLLQEISQSGLKDKVSYDPYDENICFATFEEPAWDDLNLMVYVQTLCTCEDLMEKRCRREMVAEINKVRKDLAIQKNPARCRAKEVLREYVELLDENDDESYGIHKEAS
jgi:hypothetical protein